MAGHSKWANIKHKKERVDAKKGKIFSRCAKEIISAVKTGGADPKSNARLRLAVEKAREENVPNDVIDRNIKKAGGADQGDYYEMTYELYGHGGVGIVVEIMTDNKNRIASDVRIATNKRGGNVATPGAVVYNFERKGVIQLAKDGINEDELFHRAIEAGAEDFDPEGDEFIITTDPSDLFNVKHVLENHGYKTGSASQEIIPKVFVDCDEETIKANMALIDWLEELDDVDSVYHNMNISDE